MCDDCGGTCGGAGSKRRVRSAPATPSDIALGTALDAISNLNDVMGRIDHAMATRNTVELLGADVRQLKYNAAGSAAVSCRVSTSPGRLAGISVRELAGAPAAFRLHDGEDATGDILLTANLAAGGTFTEWLMPGVSFTVGVYFELVTGALEGAVHIGARR